MSQKNRYKALRRTLKDYKLDPSIPVIDLLATDVDELLLWRDANKDKVRAVRYCFEDVYVRISFGDATISLMRISDAGDMTTFNIVVYAQTIYKEISTHVLEKHLRYRIDLRDSTVHEAEFFGAWIGKDFDENPIQSSITVISSLMAFITEVRVEDKQKLKYKPTKSLLKRFDITVGTTERRALTLGRKVTSGSRGANKSYVRRTEAWPRAGYWRTIKGKEGNKTIWVKATTCKGGADGTVGGAAPIYTLRF